MCPDARTKESEKYIDFKRATMKSWNDGKKKKKRKNTLMDEFKMILENIQFWVPVEIVSSEHS